MNTQTNLNDAIDARLGLTDAGLDLSVEEMPDQFDSTTLAVQPGTASTLGSGSTLSSCALTFSSASSWVP